MKFSSGKRVGQSGQELATAVSFSLFLHVTVFLAVFLLFTVTPRSFVPPFYSVKLVGLPLESSVPSPVQGGAPHAPEKHPAKQAPAHHQKAKKAAEKRQHPATAKTGLPELNHSKAKAAKNEPVKPVEQTAGQQSATPAPSGEAPAAAGAAAEGVAVATAQSDFKFGWYLERIRDKIGQHWNPPPDARDAKVRVVFSINRSGWLGDVNLMAEQSNGTFGFKQAAVRAVRASNPFPPLPEEFSRQTLEFTVDLMPVD